MCVCISTWILFALVTSSIFITEQFLNIMKLAPIFSTTFSSLLLVTGCVCIVCYTYITVTTYRRIHTFTQNDSATQMSHEWQMKTLKISLIITLTFIAVNVPPALMYLLKYHKKWHKWLRVLYLLNCVLNSVIYFWINSKGCKK